jgi:hypothetical protein
MRYTFLTWQTTVSTRIAKATASHESLKQQPKHIDSVEFEKLEI